MPEEEVGKVVHYFDKIGVAVIAATKGTVKKGDTVHFTGKEVDFTQTVESLEVEHKPVEEISKGKEAGLKVDQPVKEGVQVFRVTE